MTTNPENSFDDAMVRLREGDQQAAHVVFERYVSRLIALAGSKIGGQFRRKFDPEDVVQSVFNSFFNRQKNDQYELTSWEGLWGLLAAITIHKCGHKIEHFQAARRNVGREAQAPVLTDESRADWEFVAAEPAAEEVAMVDELIVKMLTDMEEDDRQILLLGLQGWSTEEIGREVGCSERTARRVIKRVQRNLEAIRDEES